MDVNKRTAYRPVGKTTCLKRTRWRKHHIEKLIHPVQKSTTPLISDPIGCIWNKSRLLGQWYHPVDLGQQKTLWRWFGFGSLAVEVQQKGGTKKVWVSVDGWRLDWGYCCSTVKEVIWPVFFFSRWRIWLVPHWVVTLLPGLVWSGLSKFWIFDENLKLKTSNLLTNTHVQKSTKQVSITLEKQHLCIFNGPVFSPVSLLVASNKYIP